MQDETIKIITENGYYNNNNNNRCQNHFYNYKTIKLYKDIIILPYIHIHIFFPPQILNFQL